MLRHLFQEITWESERGSKGRGGGEKERILVCREEKRNKSTIRGEGGNEIYTKRSRGGKDKDNFSGGRRYVSEAGKRGKKKKVQRDG